MYEFLLAQRHFVALKKYFDFLRVLPATLDQLKRHSDNLQRQGHVLTTLPDAERLKVLASFSYGYLERLEADISALGKVCNENLSYIAEFADESRKIAAQTSKTAENDGFQRDCDNLEHQQGVGNVPQRTKDEAWLQRLEILREAERPVRLALTTLL